MLARNPARSISPARADQGHESPELKTSPGGNARRIAGQDGPIARDATRQELTWARPDAGCASPVGRERKRNCYGKISQPSSLCNRCVRRLPQGLHHGQSLAVGESTSRRLSRRIRQLWRCSVVEPRPAPRQYPAGSPQRPRERNMAAEHRCRTGTSTRFPSTAIWQLYVVRTVTGAL